MARRALAFLSFAAILVLLIPIPYQVCPSWDVLVVDSFGHPISGITIRPNYQDYSVEKTSHEVDQIADLEGKAMFPQQIASRPLAWRGLGAAISVLTQGVHASPGRHATVFAFGQGLQGSAISNGYVTDWTGKPDHMSSKIVLNAQTRK